MTFNIDNLFARRPSAAEPLDALPAAAFGEAEAARRRLLTEAAALLHDDESRGFAALAIRAGTPDVVLLQEVESAAALTFFHDHYLVPLGGPVLPHRAVLEGNDPRGIALGVMSRLPIDAIASHRHLQLGTLFDAGFRFENFGISHHAATHDRRYADPETIVFCRDCLEIRLDIEGRPLLLFNVHFKAPTPSRAHTLLPRMAEAAAVVHLLRQRALNRSLDRWLVAGDLNDYAEREGEPVEGHALAPLLDSGLVEDCWPRIEDPLQRWTHFDAQTGRYRPLDHLLLSPALADANSSARPEIVRGGQPWRAERVAEPRFPRVGWDRPKAGVHCPMTIELEV